MAALVADQIFCCGDRLGDPIEYSGLKYKKWKQLPDTSKKSAVDQLVAHNGQLYISRNGSIEKYDSATRKYLTVSENHSVFVSVQ